ncbi:hypothetical protein BD414DRAFT_471247, partial [Trametes punicea]
MLENQSLDHEAPSPDAVIAEEMARAMRRQGLLDDTTAEHHNNEDNRPLVGEQTSYMAKLPPEILLYMFRFTLEPTHQYDPSIIQGPRNPWLDGLRTRKALMLTCKAFVGPGSAVLYEDIVLRRMGQIPALARTLDPAHTPSAENIAQLVRSIRIDSCVVWAPFADVIRENLRSILERCAALKVFSLSPHWNYRSPADNVGIADIWQLCLVPDGGLLRLPLARGLSTLDILLDPCYMSVFQAFHALMASAARLTKLKLRVTDTHLRGLTFDYWPERRLDSLQDLQYYGLPTGDPVLHNIYRSWEMPRLTALTVVGCAIPPSTTLIRKHGARLTYLHWYSASPAEDEDVTSVLSSCPHLEHLVVHHHVQDLLPKLTCPSLRFADFWSPSAWPSFRE